MTVDVDFPDVLALDMKAAVLALTPHGVTIRLEPVSPAGVHAAVVGWRVARQSLHLSEQVVLAVVPEIEGRIVCAHPSPNE